ncbi:uncharacterized protein BO88DRAFT_107384 [Aspergillus vadensis CBS 113365]|uniref:Uncharacterized protein n=1 Tax=Aspergillus vadensis (strain CBS 113365 / IMI 142717 / IBT 24658) TaxID=1448311 RepID=A0A319BML2_ASPVC|nr:hypothetical protein BO88DRAFT_107384 [Aspergillus vadensis CBS 113365]PYH73897.1 hypothetical protein BO88DRAFT_107384 [Aspergillus vadensis CBS 113365]
MDAGMLTTWMGAYSYLLGRLVCLALAGSFGARRGCIGLVGYDRLMNVWLMRSSVSDISSCWTVGVSDTGSRRECICSCVRHCHRALQGDTPHAMAKLRIKYRDCRYICYSGLSALPSYYITATTQLKRRSLSSLPTYPSLRNSYPPSSIRIAIITRLTGSSLYCLTFPARHGSLKRHFAQP